VLGVSEKDRRWFTGESPTISFQIKNLIQSYSSGIRGKQIEIWRKESSGCGEVERAYS
jgi:hypothetical protein